MMHPGHRLPWGFALRTGSAVLLACLAVSGGWRPADLAFGVALVAVAVLGARPRVPARVEVPAVVVITALFVASALPVLDPGRPIGTDWMSYLKNAIAIATGDWGLYQRWRGPGYAWASLGATALTGSLVAGSILVSFLAATALVPLTALLGRRIAGPEAGILAAALMAGWADLRIHAVSSTPYALYAALVLAGTVAILGPGAARAADGTSGPPAPGPATRRGWSPWRAGGRACLAGLAFGLAFATDQRAAPIAGIVIIGEVGATAVDWLRSRGAAARSLGPPRPGLRLATLALAALVATAVGAGTVATFPVPLLSLDEQVALQRDLHAREGNTGCQPKGPLLPTVADVVGPCGRATLRGNLLRGREAVPLDLGAIAGLVALGLVVARRGRAALLAPVLPVALSLFVVGVHNRYLVAAGPALAAAAGSALAWLSGATGPPADPSRCLGVRRAATSIALLAVLVVSAWAWTRSPGTLWSVAHGGTTLGFSLHSGPPSEATLVIRDRARKRDRVVDCARAGLRERLWPRPVETSPAGAGDLLSKRCTRLLAKGTRLPTWVAAWTVPDTPVAESWEIVERWPQRDGAFVLLRVR